MWHTQTYITPLYNPRFEALCKLSYNYTMCECTYRHVHLLPFALFNQCRVMSLMSIELKEKMRAMRYTWNWIWSSFPEPSKQVSVHRWSRLNSPNDRVLAWRLKLSRYTTCIKEKGCYTTLKGHFNWLFYCVDWLVFWILTIIGPPRVHYWLHVLLIIVTI